MKQLYICLFLTFTIFHLNTMAQSKPAFKGLELYYWSNNPTKEFKFSFLPGTNRNKTVKDILNASALDFNALKTQLENLPEQEQLFLYTKLKQNNTKLFFKKPDKNIIQEIEKIAQIKDLRLIILDN